MSNLRREAWITAARRAAVAAIALAGVVVVVIRWLNSLEFVTAQVFQADTLKRFLEGVPVTAESHRNVLLDAFRFMFRTSFASFGWGNVETETGWYTLWTGLALLAAAGWVVKVMRHRDRARGELPALLVMMAALAGNAGLMLALALALRGSHVPGRYLLPSLSALCALLITGWNALFPQSIARHAWKIVALGIVLTSWSTAFGPLARAYALPQPMSATTQVQLDMSTAARFSAGMRLLGHLPHQPAQTNQALLLQLCWMTANPISENYPVLLETVGPDGQGYGRLLTYPGHGNYPTRLWPAGQPFCDSYRVPVRGDFPAPALGHVRVTFLPPVAGGTAPTGEAHIPVTVTASIPSALPAYATDYQFDGSIKLRGYDLKPPSNGQSGLRVILQWEVLDRPNKDYHVFVHLRDTPSSSFEQADGPPNYGGYPTTLWQRGDIIPDSHDFTFVPSEKKPGPLALYVGLFDPVTSERASVVDASGQPVLNNEVILAEGLIFTIPDPFNPTDFIYLPQITHGAAGELTPLLPYTPTPPAAYPPP
jgi:hypothetical protein